MNSNGASTSNSVGAQPKKDSKKPKYSKFTQQELPACKPLLTPGLVMSIFVAIGVLFIPIGVAALLASRNVVEVVEQYETVCLPANITTKAQKVAWAQSTSETRNCARQLTVPKKMSAPVYVYYELDNFYQNHRRYVKSRSDKQLRGPGDSDVSNCKPEDTLANGSAIVPCGLIAWSLFNDSYTFQIGGLNVPVNENGIAWKSDRDAKFGNVTVKNFPNNYPDMPNNFVGGGMLNESLPLKDQEHLIVWMRTAALPTFRKLWGRIERDLNEGDVVVANIVNQYNTYTFNGHKKLVLSTTSWLGGKNDFLGIAYLSVGCISVLFAAVFFIAHLRNPRHLGDTSYLSWNRNNPVTSSSVAH